MSNNYCVYVHTNKKNGMRYIGCTGRKPVARWKNGLGYGSGTKFGKAIAEYGWDGFTHEVVFDHMDEETALQMEEILIKEFDTVEHGYNSFYSGIAGHKQWTEDLRQHQSEIRIGTHPTEETRKKLSESHKGQVPWMKGKKMPPELVEKNRLSHLGQIPWNKGIPHTEEAKCRMSEAHKNMSDETRRKMGESKKGNTYRRRAVLDTETGIVYESVTALAEILGVGCSKVCRGIKNPNSRKYKRYIYKD